MVMKLRSKGFCRGGFKCGNGGSGNNSSTTTKGSDNKGSCNKINCGGGNNNNNIVNGETKWELRPGGMIVQKRESGDSSAGELINVRVSTGTQWHDISIEATSTFGEMKLVLSLITSLEPNEQRLLFKGKEREDHEYLHMVGVRDKDKVLLLQDPAIKERKLHGLDATLRTISV